MPDSPSEPRGPLDGPRRAYDLAVIGAGPAGTAGAVAAARLGLSVALLDAADRPGGQYFRDPAPELAALRGRRATLPGRSAFAALRARLAASRVDHLAAHHVWSVTREDADAWSVHAVTGPDGDGGAPVRVRARAVLLATGSQERQLPFPGWTLPGVVGAGGAQAMLKSGLVLPGKRVVVAGSGPLLLAVASSLAAAGARVPAVVEASGYLGYARHPRALAVNPHKAFEAAVHGGALLRHRVPVRTRSAVTRVHGTDRVEAVTVTRLDRDWRPVPGTGRRIACDALAVGHGLEPRVELATGLGCATRRTPDGGHALAVDGLQRTTVPGLWAAGEAAGVGGWQLAWLEGEVAGVAVALRLSGRTGAVPGEHLRALRRRRDRLRSFADAMAAAHAPGEGWTDWLTDDTDVCRCEEVTAGRVRAAVAELGAHDARTVKLLTRAGMGWCQGRVCGTAVTCLAAAARDGGTARRTASAPAPARRPLAVPVPLGVLAALDDPEPEPRDSATPETPVSRVSGAAGVPGPCPPGGVDGSGPSGVASPGDPVSRVPGTTGVPGPYLPGAADERGPSGATPPGDPVPRVPGTTGAPGPYSPGAADEPGPSGATPSEDPVPRAPGEAGVPEPQPPGAVDRPDPSGAAPPGGRRIPAPRAPGGG
ncbi:FAD-dependent oxidoreductase [Streptomyces mobaraensis NBRC 13819 = DSM 40847]|uniref:Putative oxidoreductase n=1 Tax=Streptomyces mobaraensis (strain ATCC 29032 / DSM 40847 / JCM 4168 / NBRC 13819 / NCIMB 11159 / IPCR 16-22) TaxID=1223523 RepID=M3CDE8_STRM1|nr:NAD(P)/FAD-dependent oxidoreductase [Streptomyces mobaraensis]EMF02097.1 putative oxidoreductase [Streptomyces mobaraensis NBRC 13819 = DSM 40847]QTT76711.1 FAD-dependent oxidoreductase [Streptomyces mobaraensis NBRC 13819 = DSM 40847]